MRLLEDLIEREQPAWPMVQAWIAEAKNPVSVLPVDPERRGKALHQTQVTTRSPMGALVYETGGLWVDHGWIRVLGSGCEQLPRGLPDWNRTCLRGGDGPPPLLLVADDIVGGFFAINGGAFDSPLGAVMYRAPDTLGWEQITTSYTDFLFLCFSGDLERFYRDARWSAWAADAEALRGDQGILVYPFLWAEGPPVEERARGVVPLLELWRMHDDFAAKLSEP